MSCAGYPGYPKGQQTPQGCAAVAEKLTRFSRHQLRLGAVALRTLLGGFEPIDETLWLRQQSAVKPGIIDAAFKCSNFFFPLFFVQLWRGGHIHKIRNAIWIPSGGGLRAGQLPVGGMAQLQAAAASCAFRRIANLSMKKGQIGFT